jgi:penicillin-binding protein 1A
MSRIPEPNPYVRVPVGTYRADLATQEEARFRRQITFIITAILGVAIASLVGWLVFNRWAYQDMPPLPEPEALWSVKRELSVRLLDKDGNEIARRGPIYGQAVEVDDLPAHLVFAFLAIEDRRFFEHDGVDVRALMRALWVASREGALEQGGSTLTQQLIKNLVLTPERTIKRKLQEMRLARQLEGSLSKQEILGLYLNRTYLGGRAYGVDGAARRYFDKPAREVTLAEAALLAALPKAPSRLNPAESLDQARARARLVLASMAEAGFISGEEAAQAAKDTPFIVSEEVRGEPHEIGFVFDTAVQLANDLVAGQPGDLIITTTIDPKVQQAAAEVVAETLDARGSKLGVSQAALIALDRDGGIAAMVGGRSYETSKFNRVTQAKRQPGSAFKPFVYAAALEAGIGIQNVVVDEPVRIEGWEPGNYYEGYRGRMTIRTAFENSVNTVAVRLATDISPAKVAELADRFGIGRRVEALPSIALGSEWVTLEGLTAAYAVFRDEGRRMRPHLVTKIEDTRGRILYERPELPPITVYDPEKSLQMAGLLRSVVVRGTGGSAQPRNIPVAGKTGTSQEWRDALFVGYSPLYVAGVWVGNDDNSPTRKVTGAGLPAEIWRDFMARAHGGERGGDIPGIVPPLNPEADARAVYFESLARHFASLAQ